MDFSNISKFFDNDLLNYDFQIYLPSMVLRKVDRMSMANGLECRAPILSPDVIDLARSLTYEQKTQSGQKGLFIKLHIKKYPNIPIQKKMGFSVSKQIFYDKDIIFWLTSHFSSIEISEDLYRETTKIIYNLNMKNSSLGEINKLWSYLVLSFWMKSHD